MQEGKLCAEFTEWLKKREELAGSRREELLKSGSLEGYEPLEDAQRFSTQECQEVYLKILKENGSAGDVAAVRFQAGALRSCERAYLLRHATVPRLLAHAYGELTLESNGLYGKYLTDTAADFLQNAKKLREEKAGY